MPTQTFQYFIPVGSTSVSITAAFFGAGGVTLDIETTQQAVGVNSPVITPNFTLANTAPSASTHGIDYGDTAVGRLHMLSRMYTPGTTQNFMVSADVVDPSGIDHVEVWCHGSSASSSTVSKNAVGVQGYNFNMFFPAGVTSNGTTKVYAKLVPVNGSSRVIDKDIRCVNPNVLVVNPGDLTNNDIASVVGFQSGGTYEDNRLVKLTTGNYIISQGVKGATNGYWNEVRAHEDNTGPVNVEPIIVVGNPGITQERGGARASIRLEWCVFEGVTLDVGRGAAIRADDGGRYLGYNNCTIWDSWTDLDNGGRTYGAASNELVQYLFDEYSGDGSVIARHEVHNTKINASNAGGACEYMNVSANCDWDVMFLNLNWNTDGRISGRSIFDDGLSINKLENMGGDRAMHQRRSDINYLLVTGMTSDGTDTTIHVENPSGGTFSWDLSANSYVRDAGSSADDYYGRGDYMLDYWKGDGGTGATAEAHAVETRKRLYHPNNFIRLYGSSADMAHRIVALNEDYTTTGLTVGDSILTARWYHPDSFQVAGDSGTPVGVTVDNVLVQDYRVYQNHQPMLFNNFGVNFNNVVFSNCSFEQYTIPRLGLLAQIKGTPRRMAMKYCSLPTTLSLAFRTSNALWIPPIRFIADSCVFKHITLDDLGATMDNTWFNNCSYVRATNFDGSGATFDGSTKQDEGFYDITDGGNITRFGVPTSSVKTSTTKGLPYTLTGTERGTTREIGAYEVGDTPIGYAGAIKLRVFAGGDIGGIQLINYEGFTLGQEYSVKAIDSHLGYNGSGSTTGIDVNWTGSGLTLGNTTGSTASFTPTNSSWSITAATGDLIDASIRIQQLTYLTPGTGFTTVTTAADVADPGGYPMALQGTVIMQWTDQPLRATESDSMTVGVVADHYNGMEKVTFIADNGTPVDVTSTVNTRGFDEYVATLDMSGVTVGTSVEVRAIGTPIAGIPRVLQNSIPTSTSVSNDWKEGKNSSFVTKAASVIESTTGITLGLVEIINDALPANANNNIYRITIPGGTYDTTNGDSQTYNFANPNIPIELVGVGDATVIQASTYARSSSHVFNGPLHFKNMKIIQGTVGFRPSGNNHPNSMHILENVNYDTLRQEPTIGSIYTDSVGGTYEWTPANNGDTQPSGTEIAYLTKVYTDAANELGFVSAVTPTSSGDIGRGVWIMESTITGEVGENLRMLRNVQAKTLQDASHNSITLNLTMVNAQSGIGDPYVLQPDVQVWKPGVDYTGIPVLFTNPANGRAGLYGGGSADMLAPKDEFGRGNTGWYDASPHCDGWQSRPTNVIGATGDDYTMDNIWCEGLVCDATSYVQPWFLRSSEALKNVMWKNWEIKPSTLSPGTPLTYSQIPTPMDHWVMDNCTWPAGAPEDVYGELLLSWEDPNDKIPNSGLGQICNDGVSTGLKNVIWRNSSVRNLTLAWDDDVQPQNPSPAVPTTFADMVSDFNGASYSNWSFAVDEFTAANSWLAGDGPASPTNLVLVHSGLSEAQSTIGISSYTVDGSPTPYISSYQWYFDDALIGGVTGSTLALVDADIGKVPRVVVTATNNQGSTTAGYTFAGVTAEGGTENWSTWENGIWYVPIKENNPTGEIIEASSVYISTAPQGMEGVGTDGNNYPMTRYWNITGGDTVPPAVAVWNKTETAWLGTSEVMGIVPDSDNSTVVYDTNPSANGYYGYTHVGDEIIIIYLTQAPLDFGNWPAYDGPTGP